MRNVREARPALYIFGWPSFLGGADTKLAHLLLLLHDEFAVTVIPNDAFRLRDRRWAPWLKQLGIQYTLLEQLPRKLTGVGLSLCNGRFFTDGIAQRAKRKGLKIIWSSEMMWHHPGEPEALKSGVVDKVLFVSELQRRALAKGCGHLPWAMTGNYIDPALFPFQERQNQTFTIGRLSRADPVKYPEDFPVFYEGLGLPDVRFRVMAWSPALARKYCWHPFDRRWDLLPAEAEPQVQFLQSLDLFVYPLGHNFREAWGRSTVEAMLTGAIPLVPPGHHLEHLIVPGESGFVCDDITEYQRHAQRLFYDYDYRRRLSAQCCAQARDRLCNRAEHLKLWQEALA